MSRQDKMPLFFVQAYYHDTVRALSRAYAASGCIDWTFPAPYMEWPEHKADLWLRLNRFREVYAVSIDALGPISFYIPQAIDVLETYIHEEPPPYGAPDFPPPSLHCYAMQVISD